MSKALKPLRLDLDPNFPNAAKQWKHWKRTFDNCIEECGDTAPDRFRSIFNFISAEVFVYVEECETYEAVIETLDRLYVKTPNKIFARHDLATRKQQPGESLDEFLEEQKKLSKHCGFDAVTAETYRSEMIRHSFINGLTSNYIRQRLLENFELSLDRAYEIARTLHTAKKNSELYIQQSPQLTPSNVAASSTNDQSSPHINPDQESLAALRKQTPVKKSPATIVEASFMPTVLLALPVTLFAITVQRKEILPKYANIQRNLPLSMQFISLHSVLLHPLAPLILSMLRFRSK